MQDRDFYDIYRDTRRKTARNLPEQSIDYGAIKTDAIGYMNHTTTNQTKSVLIDKNGEQKSYKDLDELN